MFSVFYSLSFPFPFPFLSIFSFLLEFGMTQDKAEKSTALSFQKLSFSIEHFISPKIHIGNYLTG